MSESFVSLEMRGDVALVRLDRPKVNALSMALLNELASTFDAFASDPPGAVVLTGGERIFSAGADISELAEPANARAIANAFAGALESIEALPRAVIAAISGVAVGGGCEIALACDFRFASSGARLGQPEILLGVIPGAGGTQRLMRLVGLSRAKDLVLTGRQVQADEAASIGLVDRVIDGNVIDVALDYAAQLASGARDAQGLAKAMMRKGADLDLEDALALERDRFVDALSGAEAAVGLSSFLEHGVGKADFSKARTSSSKGRK